MRKYLLNFILVFTLVMSGCYSSCEKDKAVSIELKGNTTTGYNWYYTIADNSIISIKENVKYFGKKGVMGAESLFTYTFYPIRAGKTTATFVYKRSWDENDILETIIYDVTVNEYQNITVVNASNKEAIKVTYKSVSMEQGLLMMSSDKDYVLLDVRREDEYASGHIPGAIMHTNELMTKQNTEDLLKNKAQNIYVYCRSGRRSKEASKKLIDYGYQNVIEIGGIMDYKGDTEK